MSKKNKKNREVDLTTFEQEEMLRQINDALDNGESIDINSDNDCYDEDIMSELNKAINERMGCISCDGYHDPDEEVVGNKEISVVKSENIDNDIIKISISLSEAPFKILMISDGIKSVCIDLNTILEDNGETQNIENIAMYSYIALKEAVTHFYPSLLIPLSSIDDTFRHITEIDEQKFNFYDYHGEDDSTLITGYYIDDESLQVYQDVIVEITKQNKIISFFNALRTLTSSEGFSLSYTYESHMYQIMATDKYAKSNTKFINILTSDKDTEINENTNNDSIYNVVSILPFGYVDKYFDTIISNDDNVDDIRENYTENEECDEEDELDIYSDENEGNIQVEPECQEGIQLNVKQEVSVEVSEVSEVEESSEDDYDGLLDDFSDEPDSDEMEREYFGNVQEKKTSMKPKRMNNNSDESLVVKRINR